MVDVFRALDLEYCASNPGLSFEGLQESIVNHGGNRMPEFLTCLHEESAVAMAHGYAKIEGKPMMALLHGTVGLQHAAMAIYNAYADRVPVYITVGLDYGGVVTAHNAVDMAAMVRDFVKWDHQPGSLGQFGQSATRAYALATTPPMAPVVLVLDAKLQKAPLDDGPAVPTLSTTRFPSADSGSIKEIARLLVEANNPRIVAGQAARTQEGIDLLVELAELIQAPVNGLTERLNFPSRHPLAGTGTGLGDLVLNLEPPGRGASPGMADGTTITISSAELLATSNYNAAATACAVPTSSWPPMRRRRCPPSSRRDWPTSSPTSTRCRRRRPMPRASRCSRRSSTKPLTTRATDSRDRRERHARGAHSRSEHTMTGRIGIASLAAALWMGGAPKLAAQDRAIQFPDVPGYRTLVVDLHIHSVFSDGMVWPDIRVDEARRDGLDLIAVTEHLEYQPHADDIPHPDRNRSFELATGYAERQGTDLLVVNGAEITRDMPPGHVNAVFLSDANALLADDALDAFRAADRQGGFIFWNHPAWTSQRPDGVARLTDMHRELIRDGLLSGIEVANGAGYTAEALQIAIDHDLTILGVSDIHGLIDWDYDVHGDGHRTVTLVLARERTAGAVREALLARRTIAWLDNLLIGREAALMPLLETSLTVSSAAVRSNSEVVAVTLSNASDAAFELRSLTAHRFAEHSTLVRVPPHGEAVLGVTGEVGPAFDLEFEVLNAVTAPDTHPSLRLHVEVEDR